MTVAVVAVAPGVPVPGYRYAHAAIVAALAGLVLLGIDRLRLARARRDLAPSVRAQAEAGETESPADSAFGVLLLLATAVRF